MNNQSSQTSAAVHSTLSGWQTTSLVAGVIGIVALIGLTLVSNQPALFWQSYLVGFAVAMMLTLGCVGLTLLLNAVRSYWGFPILRMCEAGARLALYMIVPFLLLWLGLSYLYPWARPEEVQASHVLQHRDHWMHMWGFLGRGVAYLLLWGWYAWYLSNKSLEQDRTGDLRIAQKRMNVAAPGIVVFMLTATLAMTDWYMSLEVEWFSTMFAVIQVVGGGLAMFALTTLILTRFYNQAPYAGVLEPQRHFRDLGNLLFTFVILWGYTSFSQFLITWSGNLPEEIGYYTVRYKHEYWNKFFWGLAVFHFFTPFLILLSSRVKRTPNMLARVVFLILIVRIVDMLWTLVPSFGRTLQLSDLAAVVGFGGIWFFLFFQQFTSRPLLPTSEPRLQEVAQHG